MIKTIPYVVLVLLGGSSYFFDMPLFPLIIMMGIALYGVYKIFMIINLPTHKIKVLDDGVEYRGIKYEDENHNFYYSEFVQKFLGILPIQEDYYFYIMDENDNLIIKVNCMLYEVSERNELILLTK